MLPILYSFRRCPYAMRARLALAKSGQKCELREVVLRDKPVQLLQASPKGTVPVLVLPNGRVIEQSLDIMLWALEQNDPDGWLAAPGRENSCDQMLALIYDCDATFKLHLDRYKYPDRYENVDALTQRQLCSEWLMQLEERLAQYPFLYGDRATVADAAIMPFVRQFAQVDRGWFDVQPWSGLKGWLGGWLESELFSTVMHKYDRWDGGTGVPFP